MWIMSVVKLTSSAFWCQLYGPVVGDCQKLEYLRIMHFVNCFWRIQKHKTVSACYVFLNNNKPRFTPLHYSSFFHGNVYGYNSRGFIAEMIAGLIKQTERTGELKIHTSYKWLAHEYADLIWPVTISSSVNSSRTKTEFLSAWCRWCRFVYGFWRLYLVLTYTD